MLVIWHEKLFACILFWQLWTVFKQKKKWLWQTQNKKYKTDSYREKFRFKQVECICSFGVYREFSLFFFSFLYICLFACHTSERMNEYMDLDICRDGPAESDRLMVSQQFLLTDWTYVILTNIPLRHCTTCRISPVLRISWWCGLGGSCALLCLSSYTALK